jgi:hypothetical protein
MANPVPAGSNVSAGTYRCTNCGYQLSVDSMEHLPPCPSRSNRTLGHPDRWRLGERPLPGPVRLLRQPSRLRTSTVPELQASGAGSLVTVTAPNFVGTARARQSPEDDAQVTLSERLGCDCPRAQP